MILPFRIGGAETSRQNSPEINKLMVSKKRHPILIKSLGRKKVNQKYKNT